LIGSETGISAADKMGALILGRAQTGIQAFMGQEDRRGPGFCVAPARMTRMSRWPCG
jgi:hypothetical protein